MRGIESILVAAALLLAGCSGDEPTQAGSPTRPEYLDVTPGAAASPLSSPSPSPGEPASPSPTPSPSPAVEVVEAASPVPVQPVRGVPGEPYDPREVYDAVVVELNKLLVAPDPDQLELTVSRDCDCFQGWYDFFQRLSADGARFAEMGSPNILHFEVVEKSSEQFAVYLVEQSDGSPVLDASTLEVVRDPGPAEPEAKELTLRLEGDSWRIVQLRYLVDADGNNLGTRLLEGLGR